MQLIESLIDIIFPNVCGFCEKICKESLCAECEKNIYKSLRYKIDNYDDKYFERHAYIVQYHDVFREKILEYKFNDKSYLYKTFVKIILKNEKICKILEAYDIIIPVPIHKNRKLERGYNQSSLIAREIAKYIDNIKYIDNLKKIRNNTKQSVLNKQERIENVKNAYKTVNKEIIYDKNIILFDDIYTTGATVNECAKVLKENGAKEILVLTLAK